MLEKEVEQLLKSAFDNAWVYVEGDGAHFDAIIVSDAFDNLNSLKRQQLVYKSLGDNISSGKLHALSMKTYTFSEWDALDEKPVDFN